MKTRVLATIATVLITIIGASYADAADLRPLEQGSERFFAVTWDAAQRHGRPVVEGYVANTSPYTVGNVRVLVDSIDGAGSVVDQRVSWIPGTLGGHDRLYFEVPVDAAPRYGVRVFSYDRIESAELHVEAP
jgi:hypothetical protein